MASLVATGREDIPTMNRAFGRSTVNLRGIKSGDRVLLTPHVTNGGNGPEGRGPLYCAFVEDIEADRFTILVYDIQGGVFNVTVPVEWAVFRNAS